MFSDLPPCCFLFIFLHFWLLDASTKAIANRLVRKRWPLVAFGGKIYKSIFGRRHIKHETTWKKKKIRQKCAAINNAWDPICFRKFCGFELVMEMMVDLNFCPGWRKQRFMCGSSLIRRWRIHFGFVSKTRWYLCT